MGKLRYCPELNKVSGGITSTILMLQLEYWFEKTGGDAFFKFLEPCEATAYREGDSWCEELGFSKGEFRTAFSKIGKVYKSKKEFNESLDKFDGKMYLSYFDRIKRLTFYMRNTDLVEEIMDMEREGRQISRSEEDESPISVDYLTDQLHHKKSAVPYEEIIEVYHETCVELPRVEKMSYRLRKNMTSIWQLVGADKGRIRQAFEKVRESDFLSGRIVGKAFRASLEWIMQGDTFEAILGDKYTVNFGEARSRGDDRKERVEGIKKPKGNKRFNNILSHNWDFDKLEALEQEYIERQSARGQLS